MTEEEILNQIKNIKPAQDLVSRAVSQSVMAPADVTSSLASGVASGVNSALQGALQPKEEKSMWQKIKDFSTSKEGAPIVASLLGGIGGTLLGSDPAEAFKGSLSGGVQAMKRGDSLEQIAEQNRMQQERLDLAKVDENDFRLKGSFGSMLEEADFLTDDEREKLIRDRLTYESKGLPYLASSEFQKARGRAEGQLGLAGELEQEKAYGKKEGERLQQRAGEVGSAERELSQIQDLQDRIFGEGGLASRADIGYGDTGSLFNRMHGSVRRNLPTNLVNEEAQTARQEMRNILGGLRLDQMKYLKGAISDKEQEFLDSLVSGDITKYTPAEMQGTFNSISNKLERTITGGQKPKKSKYKIIEVR